eukprot:CAMPEP_0114250374 /NCGR_PEP_ID=MMETSP0058-20121206/14663_1 /TAXON_ID=36894 /ORGANISM="Pyramimonas parkeae, CCMP726" /LENGTH=64 /DNA_ID=CAMNT_0001364025 /DNA_START=157 /DNA_END=347 /DNA_ORIENTATION=+
MPYVSNGSVLEKRSPWRLSLITDFFWSIVNGIAFFFQTLLSMDASEDYVKKSRAGNRRGGGGGG